MAAEDKPGPRDAQSPPVDGEIRVSRRDGEDVFPGFRCPLVELLDWRIVALDATGRWYNWAHPGAPLSSNPDDPTRTSDRQTPTAPAARAAGDGRFAPGTLLAGRYRIVGLLGRGGMGEVYRAQDLKLAQDVALKLLPARVAADPVRLARFHNEVRLARQVSHPGVAWYATPGILACAVVFGLVAFAAWASLRGRPLLGRWLEDQ